MIPQGWDDIAGVVALLSQGCRLVRQCWKERDNIRAKIVLTAKTEGRLRQRLQEQVRRDWQAFNGLPPLARLGLATLFLNFGVVLIWDIVAGTVPPLLTVYPVVCITSLALYAVYLGVQLTGRFIKKTVWHRQGCEK